MEQTPVDLPRCEASRYMVKTIAVNLKLWLCFQTAMRSRKSQKVKVTFFFFFQTITTAGLAKWSGCEPATRTKQVTTLLRLLLFSTTKLHKTVSSLHSLTEVHPV